MVYLLKVLRNVRWRLLLLVSVIFSPVLASSLDNSVTNEAPSIDSLKVAVAANFAAPLREIANRYYAQSGVNVVITVSSSGTLFAQLMHGANFDVFLSADTKRPQALVEAGRITADDIVVYAKGRLAFLSSDTSMSLDKINAAQLEGQRFAIANPKLAPYGEAAKQYLINMAKWTLVKPHIVMGKNVLQSYQFFTTANAKYALVAYSLAKNDANAVLIPERLHAPILQALAITASSERNRQARQFVDFIMSQEIQQRLPEWGYQQSIQQRVEHATQGDSVPNLLVE